VYNANDQFLSNNNVLSSENYLKECSYDRGYLGPVTSSFELLRISLDKYLWTAGLERTGAHKRDQLLLLLSTKLLWCVVRRFPNIHVLAYTKSVPLVFMVRSQCRTRHNHLKWLRSTICFIALDASKIVSPAVHIYRSQLLYLSAYFFGFVGCFGRYMGYFHPDYCRNF
jgi:hypothetical protein